MGEARQAECSLIFKDTPGLPFYSSERDMEKSIFPFLPNPTNYRGAVRTWRAHSFFGGGGEWAWLWLASARQECGRGAITVPSCASVAKGTGFVYEIFKLVYVSD